MRLCTEGRNVRFGWKAASATTERDAGVPGEDRHHGVKVDGAVGDSLQHKLFICNRTKTLGNKRGKTKPSRLLLLTDDLLAMLDQHFLDDGPELLDGFDGLQKE